MKAVAICLLALLGGCASRAEIAADHHERCIGYGFRQGTEAYANCRLQADTQRRDHREQRRQAIIDSVPDYEFRTR